MNPSSRRILYVIVGLAVASRFSIAWAAEAASPNPRGAWPVFPRPAEILIQAEARTLAEQVLQQTAAGVAASSARKTNIPGPFVWIDQWHHPDFAKWFQTWITRTGVDSRYLEGDVWALVSVLQQRGLIQGYVVYRADLSGSPAYDSKDPDDVSLNLATSLCAPLAAVAVEEKLQAKADSMGLKQVADCRGKDYSWILHAYGDRFNRRIGVMLSPCASIGRDIAVACDALVVLNCRGGGFEEMLQRAAPGGLVFGWGLTPEDRFVSAISKRGLEMVASNWSYNVPVLASVPVALPLPRKDEKAPPASPDPTTRYVAFLESDGDNITWLTGDYTSGASFFAHPERGTLPFGWSVALPALHELASDTWQYLVRSATPADDFIQFGLTGYGFVDETPENALATQASALEPHLRNSNVHALALFTHEQWNSPAAMRSFDTIVKNCPSLHGVLPLQYAPYAAGRGALTWRKRGSERIPVLSARAAIWKVGKPTLEAGAPEDVAVVLNQWASKPSAALEDRCSWVVVHAWSQFDNGVTGFGAAKACAMRLDSKIKIVKPSELIEMLYCAGKEAHL